MPATLRTLACVVAAGCLLAGCSDDEDEEPPASAPAARGKPPLGSPGGAPATGTPRRGVRLVEVGRFDSPVYVTQPPGERDRLFVVERAGRIRVLRGGRKLRAPFLDIARSVSSRGEQGLQSMAFAPDYQSSGRFYIYYSDRRGHIRLEEWRRDPASPDRADRRSRRRLLFQRHPRYVNHYAGQLHFGPDGLLYVSVGDGGGKGNPLRTAQDRGSLLGKILRIDPRPGAGRPYRIPPDNPFAGRRGAKGEVYAYGLRNPFRFSFDRATGDLTIADVGQDAVEEVNFLPRGRGRGANFGWNRFEGRRRYRPGSAPGHVRPVIEQSNPRGWCSVIGGYVVRDRSLPSLFGRYVYGDFCQPKLHSAKLAPRRAMGDRAIGPRVKALASFGEDSAGRLYAVSLSGPVYRLEPR